MNVNYDRVCRLCLSSRGELLPIFPTTSSDDSEPHVLALKIQDCVSVQINENDDLPLNACRKCVDNVNNWHIFKGVCEKTQNKLLSLKKDGSLLEEVKVKSEPLSDEAYDDGVIIDGSYPDFERNSGYSNKLQPEGPPILASLGLTPRSDKGVDSENNEEEEEEEDDEGGDGEGSGGPALPHIPEVSITVLRGAGGGAGGGGGVSGELLRARTGFQQLASKQCLVCGREYRYSHNARRHELTAHNYDRYTNKVQPRRPLQPAPPSQLAQLAMPPKMRPNPFNPKARLLPNPLANKMQLLPRTMPGKMVPHKVIPKPVPIKPAKPQHNNLPYPLRIKALKDLQIKKKEPQILKTLLTAKPEVLVSEPEIMNSDPGSPETLISEPEISSFQVETILTEPDGYDSQPGEDDPDDDEQNDNQKTYDTVNMESDNEIEIAREREPGRGEQSLEDDDKMSEGDALPDHTEYHHDEDNHDENQEEEGYGEGHEDAELDEAADDIGEDEYKESEEGLDAGDAAEHDNHEDGQEQEGDEEREDEDELPPMAPVVEISEGMQAADDEHDAEDTVDPNDAVDEDAENDAADDTADAADDMADAADDTGYAADDTGYAANDTGYEANDTVDGEADATLPADAEPDPDKTYVTKAQREFIRRYRKIIEQINTKRCLCCEKDYPRRKSVIQHLQKNGHKVPKHTCYNCVVTFGHIGALLSHMRANVCTNLWKIIYNESGITDDMVVDPVNPKAQYRDIFNARSYACKLCPVKFQLKQSMTKHVLDAHEDGQANVPLNCVHCRYRFKDRNQLKKHQRSGDCIIDIACDLCPERFPSVQDFTNHALEQHAGNPDLSQASLAAKCVDGRPTDCPLCDKKLGTYQTVVKHLKAYHDEQRPHYCQNCDDKFEKPEELHKHIFTVHSQQAMGLPDVDMSIVKEEAEEYHYSCTECNAIFETVDAWTDHQVAEHDQVAHHCDQCDKKFLRPSELAEHKNTHLRVKLYPCSICADSYSTPQRLAEHVAAAHPGAGAAGAGGPGGDFYCTLCVRGFKSRQAYSNHMRIHSKVPTTNRRPQDPKGFSPQIIGKPIKQFPILQGAQAATSFVQFKPNCNVPNAPYSCDICGKGFMHKKNIWKHKKVLHADIVGERNDSEENTMHGSTEDEEFNVDENGIALSTPRFNSFNFSSLASTAPAAPPPAMFACELCYKKFPLKSSVIKHKRAKHGIVNQPAAGEHGSSDTSRTSCTICKITFSDKKSYYRHRKNVHKSTAQACKICGIPLGSTLELYEHLKAAHARELLGYNANQGSASKPTSVGQELDVDYEAEQEANDPNSEYQARYPCDNCGKQFVGLLALQNHQCLNPNVETSSQTFNCEICHKSYTSIAALKSHRGWHLRSPDGKAAANNTSLWMPQHKVTNKVSKHEVVDAVQLARVSHAAPTPPAAAAKRRLPPEVEITVVNPNKKLRSDDSLEVEAAAGAGGGSGGGSGADDRYCTICDKEFTKRAAFQRHMDEVHQPNSVFCPVCDKSFTRKSTLLVHMRKHYEGGEGSSTGAAPEDEEYACDVCDASCPTPASLRAHKMKHHGEESEDEEEEVEEEDEEEAETVVPGEFTCGQCGDGVATPRDLIAHRTMHATPSKYFCAVCKVYFARGSELSSHTRARHGGGGGGGGGGAAEADKPYFPCAMCDRFYMNKKSLQRHIDMAH